MRRLAGENRTVQVTKTITSCVILTVLNAILSLALLLLFIASDCRLKLLPITDRYYLATRW